MSQNVVARLRERMAYREAHDTTPETPVGHDELSALLDIVEAVATTSDPRDKYGYCDYCKQHVWARTSQDHTPNCAYRRSRELCGMDQDGAE